MLSQKNHIKISQKGVSDEIITGFFAIVMLFITIIVLFGDNFHLLDNYCLYLKTAFPRYLHAIIGFIALCLLFAPFYIKFKNKAQDLKIQKRNFFVYGVVFFFTISTVIFSYFFYTGWDVQIIMDSARQLAYEGVKTNQWYFCECPNNIFITEIYAAILWIFKPFHLGKYDFFTVLVFQNFLSTLALIMLYQAVFSIFGRRDISAYSALLYTAIAGLSPWMSIPYSDAFGIIFPIALIWIYTCSCFKNRQRLKWFLLGTVAVAGYKIKPQTSFPFFAIILYEVINILQNKHKLRSLANGIRLNIVAVTFGIVASMAFTTICCKMYIGKSEKKLGVAHYLMMGQNRSSYGVWNEDDLAFARQFHTNRERNRAELDEAIDRIHDMGFIGFANHICQKAMLVFYDGTFYWGYEGEFYKEIHPEVIPRMSDLTRNTFYNYPAEGNYYKLWSGFVNSIWYGCLTLALISVFGRNDERLRIVMLTLTLLIIFQLLFETRSRYIFSNLPLFLIMSCSGINLIYSFIEVISKK